MKRKTWLEMSNGKRLETIEFVAWIDEGEGRETCHSLHVSNPPIYEGDTNLFSRLGYEGIQDWFKRIGHEVDYIIRGETAENSCRDCYVYDGLRRVPFAVIRPRVFVH